MKLKVIFSVFVVVVMMTACNNDDATSCAEQTWYQDLDNDGFGNPNQTLSSCTQPNGYVSDNTDCDDNNVNVNPNALEASDGIDNDCDGMVDECVDDAQCGAGEVCVDGTCVQVQTFYADMDNDGYGNPNNSQEAGVAPLGYVVDNTDCDDANSAIHPSATEIIDSYVDEDCNGATLLTAFADNDGDGYGDPLNSTTFECFLPCTNAQEVNNIPAGYVLDNTDCDDSNININPGAAEYTLDGIDNDCDGLIDECDSNVSNECDCTDGVDNDGDGDTDCDDSDCTGVSGC